MVERDHIGFDPVAWVDRLLDVAAGSQFTDAEKETITRGLHLIKLNLNRKPGTGKLYTGTGD